MKISIITIALNNEQEIERTLLSVINQENIHLEYIVIDGKSDDNTPRIIGKYLGKIAYFVSEADKGITDAFNKGLRQATGEIVGFVNAGDWLEPNILSCVAEQMLRGNIDVLYGDVQYWKEATKGYVCEADHKYLPLFMSLNHQACFARMELFKQYGFFDNAYSIASDYELMLRFFNKGAAFVYCHRILSNMSLGGVSDVHWRENYRQAWQIRKKYYPPTIIKYLQYWALVAKKYTSTTMSRIGLESVNEFYKKHFAQIKKYK